MQLHDIEAFFRVYADAYQDLNGDAVAAHCATPMAIAQGGNVTWWAEHAPVQDNMRALCAVYREAGLDQVAHTIEQTVLMGPHDAFALVRWTLTRSDNSLLQQFRTGYHLHRHGGHTKVLLVTAFDENLAAMQPTG